MPLFMPLQIEFRWAKYSWLTLMIIIEVAAIVVTLNKIEFCNSNFDSQDILGIYPKLLSSNINWDSSPTQWACTLTSIN